MAPSQQHGSDLPKTRSDPFVMAGLERNKLLEHSIYSGCSSSSFTHRLHKQPLWVGVSNRGFPRTSQLFERPRKPIRPKQLLAFRISSDSPPSCFGMFSAEIFFKRMVVVVKWPEIHARFRELYCTHHKISQEARCDGSTARVLSTRTPGAVFG